jgi:hypothetical protein
MRFTSESVALWKLPRENKDVLCSIEMEFGARRFWICPFGGFLSSEKPFSRTIIRTLADYFHISPGVLAANL